jgi:UDP-GlcNAc:undecaprenyl-phosphate/decaprenyl-phosphate GlcNAc-1-phosphate transferase
VTFPFNIYALALLSSTLVALASLPLWERWCVRTGLVDDPGHRKIHDSPVPLAGGLTVFTALLMPLLAGVIFVFWNSLSSGDSPPNRTGLHLLGVTSTFLIKYGFARRALELAGIIFGAGGILLVGFLDDKYELRPALKFGGQLTVALLVSACGVRITLFIPSLIVSYALTVLWILTVINAFNFMDNMNGLCAGLGSIGACYFALAAAAEGQYLVTLIAIVTLGALVGFLPYNFPKARVFLGDSGSHLVGYLLAVLGILPHFYTPENPRPLAVLMPLFILGVPLFDLLWVVILRWRLGHPFYRGDNNHLSHRLVRLGLSRTRAVLVIWLAAAGLGAICFW